MDRLREGWLVELVSGLKEEIFLVDKARRNHECSWQNYSTSEKMKCHLRHTVGLNAWLGLFVPKLIIYFTKFDESSVGFTLILSLFVCLVLSFSFCLFLSFFLYLMSLFVSLSLISLHFPIFIRFYLAHFHVSLFYLAHFHVSLCLKLCEQ